MSMSCMPTAARAKRPASRPGWAAESYDRLAGWLNAPVRPASTGLWFILGGFVLTVALSLMRTSFVWWPFHPAGYALALSYAMEYFWLPVFIAWLLKFCIIRYGGIAPAPPRHPLLPGPDLRRLHDGGPVGHRRPDHGHPDVQDLHLGG